MEATAGRDRSRVAPRSRAAPGGGAGTGQRRSRVVPSPIMPAPRRYTTEAIVLTRFDLGEADRVLTLITPGLG